MCTIQKCTEQITQWSNIIVTSNMFKTLNVAWVSSMFIWSFVCIHEKEVYIPCAPCLYHSVQRASSGGTTNPRWLLHTAVVVWMLHKHWLQPRKALWGGRRMWPSVSHQQSGGMWRLRWNTGSWTPEVSRCPVPSVKRQATAALRAIYLRRPQSLLMVPDLY